MQHECEIYTARGAKNRVPGNMKYCPQKFPSVQRTDSGVGVQLRRIVTRAWIHRASGTGMSGRFLALKAVWEFAGVRRKTGSAMHERVAAALNAPRIRANDAAHYACNVPSETKALFAG